jgi:hypothetical protein
MRRISPLERLLAFVNELADEGARIFEITRPFPSPLGERVGERVISLPPSMSSWWRLRSVWVPRSSMRRLTHGAL